MDASLRWIVSTVLDACTAGAVVPASLAAPVAVTCPPLVLLVSVATTVLLGSTVLIELEPPPELTTLTYCK